MSSKSRIPVYHIIGRQSTISYGSELGEPTFLLRNDFLQQIKRGCFYSDSRNLVAIDGRCTVMNSDHQEVGYHFLVPKSWTLVTATIKNGVIVLGYNAIGLESSEVYTPFVMVSGSSVNFFCSKNRSPIAYLLDPLTYLTIENCTLEVREILSNSLIYNRTYDSEVHHIAINSRVIVSFNDGISHTFSYSDGEVNVEDRQLNDFVVESGMSTAYCVEIFDEDDPTPSLLDHTYKSLKDAMAYLFRSKNECWRLEYSQQELHPLEDTEISAYVVLMAANSVLFLLECEHQLVDFEKCNITATVSDRNDYIKLSWSEGSFVPDFHNPCRVYMTEYKMVGTADDEREFFKAYYSPLTESNLRKLLVQALNGQCTYNLNYLFLDKNFPWSVSHMIGYLPSNHLLSTYVSLLCVNDVASKNSLKLESLIREDTSPVVVIIIKYLLAFGSKSQSLTNILVSNNAYLQHPQDYSSLNYVGDGLSLPSNPGLMEDNPQPSPVLNLDGKRQFRSVGEKVLQRSTLLNDEENVIHLVDDSHTERAPAEFLAHKSTFRTHALIQLVKHETLKEKCPVHVSQSLYEQSMKTPLINAVLPINYLLDIIEGKSNITYWSSFEEVVKEYTLNRASLQDLISAYWCLFAEYHVRAFGDVSVLLVVADFTTETDRDYLKSLLWINQFQTGNFAASFRTIMQLRDEDVLKFCFEKFWYDVCSRRVDPKMLAELIDQNNEYSVLEYLLHSLLVLHPIRNAMPILKVILTYAMSDNSSSYTKRIAPSICLLVVIQIELLIGPEPGYSFDLFPESLLSVVKNFNTVAGRDSTEKLAIKRARAMQTKILFIGLQISRIFGFNAIIITKPQIRAYMKCPITPVSFDPLLRKTLKIAETSDGDQKSIRHRYNVAVNLIQGCPTKAETDYCSLWHFPLDKIAYSAQKFASYPPR